MEFLDLLFPPRCVGCGRVGAYICRDCRQTLKLQNQRCPECDRAAVDGLTHPGCRRAYGLDGLVTIFCYEGVVKKTIKLLKYRFVADVAETLIDQIRFDIYLFFSLLPKDTVIYPLPLHQDRLRWRSFNQAEKLGRFLAKKLHLKLIDGLLVRQIKRIPQADIAKRADRIKNAHGLFSPSLSFQTSKPLSILLFDDVWTTGATMKEAAKVLKRGGVKRIWGMALAR